MQASVGGRWLGGQRKRHGGGEGGESGASDEGAHAQEPFKPILLKEVLGGWGRGSVQEAGGRVRG